MHTMQRLTRAYDNALVVEFDSTSKFVWLSDQHRGDGSVSDEFTKNRHIYLAALQRYFDDGYTLIENGDVDDLWEWPRFRHIAKANKLTYDAVRQFHDDRRYLRLYGNHDMQLKDANYVRENLYHLRHFVTGELLAFLPGLQVHEAVLLRHRNCGVELLTVHGHQGDFANDQAWRVSMFTFRLFWRHLHALGIRSPSSPTRNSFKRHKVERNYVRWIMHHGTALICGHTHRERFPRQNEAPYFNSGAATFPNYITGLELADDQLTLVSWQVVPDANGYLHVDRRVLAGPRPLGDFDLRPDPRHHRRPSKRFDWTSIAQAAHQ